MTAVYDKIDVLLLPYNNLAQIYKFWKYLKYEYYKVLNKRHQKRSMGYSDYHRIWSYYVKEPHLTEDIWNWKPKLV